MTKPFMLHELKARRDELQNELAELEKAIYHKTLFGWLGLAFVRRESCEQNGIAAWKDVLHTCIAPISREAESSIYFRTPSSSPHHHAQSFDLKVLPRGMHLMSGPHFLGDIQFGEAPHRLSDFDCFATYLKEDVVAWIDSLKKARGISIEEPKKDAPAETATDCDEGEA